MNLLCPNCQKMLTVGDQSAGQLMRCPLCNGTFTVPSLPASPAPAAPTLAETLPHVPNPAPPREDVFRVASAPEAPAPPRREQPWAAAQHPEPATAPEPAAAAPSPERPDGFRVTLSLQVVPWIAPAALGLVFILLFCPWVGTLVWGEKLEWYTQSGWGTGFGSDYGVLGTLRILLLLLTLPLAVAAAAVPIFGTRLPAPMEAVWPWRAAAVVGLVAGATLLLLLEHTVGFGLEKKVEAIARNPDEFKTDELAKKLRTPEHREYAKAAVSYSFFLRLAVLCHLAALASLGLQSWMEKRGARPSPHLDIVW